jgi:hypothetical protein
MQHPERELKPPGEGRADEEQMKKIMVITNDISEIFLAHDLDMTMKVSCTISMLSILLSCLDPKMRNGAIAAVERALRNNLEWIDKADSRA